MYKKYQIILIVLVFISFSLHSQIIFSDTTTIYQYDVYCERVVITNYIIPDSTYEKLGRKGLSDLEADNKFIGYTHIAAYDKNRIYSFTDFDLCIGKNRFEYSYPRFHFSIERKEILTNLDKIRLKLREENIEIPVDRILITGDQWNWIIIESENMGKMLENSELKQFLKESRVIELKVNDITFPLRSKEECGKEKLKFNSQLIKLVGEID